MSYPRPTPWFFALLLATALHAADPRSPAVEAAARQALEGRPLPPMRISSVDGRDMSGTDARGHHLLLAFTDPRSRDEGIRWLKDSAPRLARLAPLSVYNVVFPGGVFLAPRPAIRSRVGADGKRLCAEARAALPADLRQRFDAVDVRWHVDFDRRVTALFAAPAHRLALILIDQTGRVVQYADSVDAGTLDRLAVAVAGGRTAPPAGAR